MSTALIEFDKREVELIKKTIAPGTTDDQLALFIQVCSQTGLNPFARQIYAVVRNEKQKDGSYEKKMTIQTSIDGYRLLAQRSGEYAGQDGPYWYDSKKQAWTDVWVEDYAPAAARIGVLRKGFQTYLYAVARFESYVVRKFNPQTRQNDGEPQGLWGKMPEVMIAKVAEALALRRAFPAELSGIYTKEEMDQADEPLPTTSPSPTPAPANEPNVIDAEPTPIAEGVRERLNDLFAKGKEKGLFGRRSEMARFASEVLEAEVTPDVLTQLTNDDLYRIELAIAASTGLNGAA